MRVLYILIAAAALSCAVAQELKPGDVLESIAASAKSYLRDTTEVPLKVATTTEEYDTGGKLRKTRHDSHSFTIVQARPDEYKARSSVSAGGFVFHHRSMIEQVDADITAMAAGMLLRPGNRENFDYGVSPPGKGPLFRLRYRSNRPCSFEINGRHLKLDNWCGSGEYAAEPRTYALQHFTFEAAGTPVLEGKALKSYRVEETFQTVSVPGADKPFVIPKTITVTYESDKGKTVLNSAFTLQPDSKKKDSQ